MTCSRRQCRAPRVSQCHKTMLVLVILQPFRVVGLGDDAVFTCLSAFTVIVNVEWLVNGTSLNSLQLSNAVQRFDTFGRVGSLRLKNVSVEYNNTMIQCLAITSSARVLESNISSLFVQGIMYVRIAILSSSDRYFI